MATTSFFNTKCTTLITNGAGDAVATVNGAKVEVDLYVGDADTWGTGSPVLAIQASPDGGTTWINLGATHGTISWTTGNGRLNTSGPIVVVGADKIRANLTGGTGVPSLTPQLVLRKLEGRNRFATVFAADATGTMQPEYPLPDQLGVAIFGSAFGSGTVKFQVSTDQGTTWYTVLSKAANAFDRVDFVREGQFRFVMSGSTNPVVTGYMQ